jgi:hypothetical protein
VSDTYSQFIPDWLGGNNDFKAGVQYVYSQIELPDQTDMNGRFGFRTDSAFDSANPSTYPERLFIRVPSPSDILLPMNVFVGFAQNKWTRGDLTLNLGVRYDLENTQIKPTLGMNPLFANADTYVIDKNNLAPRLGFAWNPGGSHSSVIRGGYGRFFDKVVLGTTAPFLSQSIYTNSFTAAFPTSSADPGPSSGKLPTDPFLVNGPVVNRALLNGMFPPGTMGRNTGTVYVDNPDRVVPYLHQVTMGYERQLKAQMAATVDYVHSWSEGQMVDVDLNPATRANTSRTGPITYTDLYGLAAQLNISPFVNPGAVTPEHRAVAVRRTEPVAREAVLEFVGGAGVVRRWLRPRRQRAEPAVHEHIPGARSGEPEPERRTTQQRSASRTSCLSGRFEVPQDRRTGRQRHLSVHERTAVHADQLQCGRRPERRLFDEIAPGNYCGTGPNAYCVDYKGGRNGARGPAPEDRPAQFLSSAPTKQTTVDLTFELFNIFNNWNFERPGAATGQNWYSDQRLTDFLTLTQFTGGNGQPRAANFSARFGF